MIRTIYLFLLLDALLPNRPPFWRRVEISRLFQYLLATPSIWNVHHQPFTVSLKQCVEHGSKELPFQSFWQLLVGVSAARRCETCPQL